MSGKIEVGDPVILKEDFEEQDLVADTKGYANSVVSAPDGNTYIYFMPETEKHQYVMLASRFELNEEAKNGGITLDASTIPK